MSIALDCRTKGGKGGEAGAHRQPTAFTAFTALRQPVSRNSVRGLTYQAAPPSPHLHRVMARKSPPVHRTALFSRDRRFRYRLGRRWGDGAAVCFVLLNPSTADETREDPTVRRCIGFAEASATAPSRSSTSTRTSRRTPRSCGGRATPWGATTTGTSRRPCGSASGWSWRGACTRPGWSGRRRSWRLLRRMGVEPHCLRLTASGHPEHPLRLPLGCGLVRFEREVGKVEKPAAPPL